MSKLGASTPGRIPNYGRSTAVTDDVVDGMRYLMRASSGESHGNEHPTKLPPSAGTYN